MAELIIEYSFSFSDFCDAICFVTPFRLAEPVADDFTIEEFAAWARTKPATERYNFKDEENCALAQFGKATDRAHLVGMQGTELLYRRPELYRMLGGAGTFGMLARRLEAYAVEQKMRTRPASSHSPQRRAGYVADGGSQWVKPEAYLTDIMVLEPA